MIKVSRLFEYHYAEISAVISFGCNRGIAFVRKCAGMRVYVVRVRPSECSFAPPAFAPGAEQDSPSDWRKRITCNCKPGFNINAYDKNQIKIVAGLWRVYRS